MVNIEKLKAIASDPDVVERDYSYPIELAVAEIASLRAALKPFAEIAGSYVTSLDEEVVRSAGTLGDDYVVITVLDLRRAKSTYEQTAGEAK